MVRFACILCEVRWPTSAHDSNPQKHIPDFTSAPLLGFFPQPVVIAGEGPGGGHVLVTEFRADTKWSILCWCATATRSCPPHWLYVQIPRCLQLFSSDFADISVDFYLVLLRFSRNRVPRRCHLSQSGSTLCSTMYFFPLSNSACCRFLPRLCSTPYRYCKGLFLRMSRLSEQTANTVALNYRPNHVKV